MTPVKWIEPAELVETYPEPRAARRKRMAKGETFTAVLSAKPIDVELRRLKYAAIRARKAKP